MKSTTVFAPVLVFRILFLPGAKTVYGEAPAHQSMARANTFAASALRHFCLDSQLPNGCHKPSRSDSSRIQLL